MEGKEREREKGRAHLRFAHDLAALPDPLDEDEAFARGLLVFRELDAHVRV